jgi:hypothetical protein
LEATAPTFDGTQPCMKINPEVFFPELPEKEKGEQVTGQERRTYNIAVIKAKSICDMCMFSQPCLEYALTTSVVGIWGATTERERSSIRRSRKMSTPESLTTLTNSWATPSKKKRSTP